MNTKQQGTVGMGAAIAYFTFIGYIVSIPLNDSQKYDLVVDDGKKLNRVQVKTSRFRKFKAFYVQVQQSGGSRKAATRTKFNNKSSDLLFVWCVDGSIYLIPSKHVTATNGFTLGPKYAKYKLVHGVGLEPTKPARGV
jgi:hypothetical protein